MKNKNMIIGVILSVLILTLFGYEYSQAGKDKKKSPVQIGVVSIREIFEKCSQKVEFEKKLSMEGERLIQELKGFEQEIQNDKLALSKRAEGSSDYMDMVQEIMLKEAKLEAKREFYTQDITIKKIRSQEKIYINILSAIAKVAKDKELDIVLNRDDNYLNRDDIEQMVTNPSDFMFTTETHKMLYFAEDLDITSEVLEVLEQKD